MGCGYCDTYVIPIWRELLSSINKYCYALEIENRKNPIKDQIRAVVLEWDIPLTLSPNCHQENLNECKLWNTTIDSRA